MKSGFPTFLLLIGILSFAMLSQAMEMETETNDTSQSVNAASIVMGGRSKRLQDVGGISVTYSPFHNAEYPINGGPVDIQALRGAIDADFALISQYFTTIRTYYSQYFGINIAEMARARGLKIWMGVYMTSESWGNDEVNAAIHAIATYGDTVEAVIFGNENMINFQTRSYDIIAYADRVRSGLNWDTRGVKFGTVQRVTEYLDNRFTWDFQQLDANMDFLGVNIYPFFNNNYDWRNPSEFLDILYRETANRFPQHKLVITETGFPSEGNPSPVAPDVHPRLDSAISYYNAVVEWSLGGAYGTDAPIFWFSMFDRRPYSWEGPMDPEEHFGFFTWNRQPKSDGYPQQGSGSSCYLEEGVDYVGNDIGSARSATAMGCCASCRATYGCKAFSWNNYQGGTCWLKSSKGDTVGNSAAVSGVI